MNFTITLGNLETVTLDEYVDTLADIFEVGNTIEKRLGDGFQLDDLLALIGKEQQIREIVNDAPIFWAQFKTLIDNWNTDSVVDGLLMAKDRVVANTGPLGTISGFIFQILMNAASSYQFAGETYRNAQRQFAMWKELFAGTAESKVLAAR